MAAPARRLRRQRPVGATSRREGGVNRTMWRARSKKLDAENAEGREERREKQIPDGIRSSPRSLRVSAFSALSALTSRLPHGPERVRAKDSDVSARDASSHLPNNGHKKPRQKPAGVRVQYLKERTGTVPGAIRAVQKRRGGDSVQATFSSRNCSSSVEPFNAVIEECAPAMTWVTWSK